MRECKDPMCSICNSYHPSFKCDDEKPKVEKKKDQKPRIGNRSLRRKLKFGKKSKFNREEKYHDR